MAICPPGMRYRNFTIEYAQASKFAIDIQKRDSVALVFLDVTSDLGSNMCDLVRAGRINFDSHRYEKSQRCRLG